MMHRCCAALMLIVYLVHVVAAQQVAQGQAEALVVELKQLRKQAKQHPDDPGVQATLAFKLQMLNTLRPDGGKTLRRAERAYRKALRLVGDTPGVHPIKANLAILMMHLDSAQEAVQLLDECLAVGKLTAAERGAYMFNRGKALTILGRLADADASYLAAAKEAYGVALSSYGKAVAALRDLPKELVQQLDEVSHAVRTNYVRDSSNVPSATWRDSHKQLSQQRRRSLSGLMHLVTGSSNAGQAPQAWLASAPPSDASWLHFALFQHFKKQKQYVTAWHYLTIANALQAPSAGYTPDQDWFTVRTLVQSFKGDFPNSGLEDSSAVFVVGMPRSGSTLVETMLGSHDQVYAAGEDTAMAPLTPAITQVLMSQPTDLQTQLAKLGQQYLSSMRARIPASDADTVKFTADKMLRNLWLLGYIQLILPHSCVVHVLRHPMDVALSCYAQPFGYSGTSWSWDLDHIVQQIQMTWQLADHWDTTFPGRVHVVLYEELVQHPEPVMRRLLQHCGLEWQESVLAPQNLTRHVHTASSTQVRKPLYLTSISQWQRFQAQMEPARQKLEPLIQRYEQRLEQALAAYEDAQDPGSLPSSKEGHQSGPATPTAQVEL